MKTADWKIKAENGQIIVALINESSLETLRAAKSRLLGLPQIWEEFIHHTPERLKDIILSLKLRLLSIYLQCW